jgi:multidrug resistance efflux pump
MDPLPPIPTPVSQIWKEFRIQILPSLVLVLVVAGAFLLWRNFVQPVTVVGHAETNVAHVISTQDGQITALFVERFQTVTQGQVIAIVANTDPDMVKAQLDVARTDLQVLRERLLVDKRRSEQSYYQFQQDLLDQRVTQATELAGLPRLSNEVSRVLKLRADGTASDADVDVAKLPYEAALAATRERANLITQSEKALEAIRPTVTPQSADAIDAAIKAKEEEIRETLKPSTLRAPFSGVVNALFRFPGERIVRGTPVVSIAEPTATRIVAYVRQPITRLPALHDAVQVMTQTQPRQAGRGQILRIGAQVEAINPALLSTDATRVEYGLPILVSVPDGMTIVPGEFVNLSLDYAQK